MDASAIHSKRLDAKEVIFPKQGEFIFPFADGRIKTPGGDQDLGTSTSIRQRPIQRVSNIDFEQVKISCLMGRPRMRGGLECPSTDQ